MGARRRRGKASLAVGTLALALGGGCLHDPTEIVVVVDTDLRLGTDFRSIQFFVPSIQSFAPLADTDTLPATLGFLPSSGGSPQFDVLVRASLDPPSSFLAPEQASPPVVTRRMSNIRFVSNEIRVVYVSLLKECMCVGTTCTNALTDPCRDITAPRTHAFDENHIPRLADFPQGP